MNKKNIPVDLLKDITDVLELKYHLIHIKDKDETLLHIEDIEEDSNFYFSIKSSQKIQNSAKVSYQIEYCPSSSSNNTPALISRAADSLTDLLTKWLDILSHYSAIDFPFGDPVLDYYYKEAQEEVKILDDDADTHPFNKEQREYLFEVMSAVIKKAESEMNEDNESETKLLVTEARGAQKAITSRTKNQAIKKVHKAMARAKSFGYDLSNNVLANVIIELGKMLL